MTARQPGEGRQGAKVSPETGRCGDETAQPKSAFPKLPAALARVSEQDLTTLGELMATGKVSPVFDKRCRFTELRDAFGYMEEGPARGEVAIAPDD